MVSDHDERMTQPPTNASSQSASAPTTQSATSDFPQIPGAHPFKRCFDRYRACRGLLGKGVPTATDTNQLLGEIVDFSQDSSNDVLSKRDLYGIQLFRFPSLPETPMDIYTGPVWGIREFPGFFYLPAACNTPLQIFLAHQALTTYCESPHRNNIDSVPPKPNEINSDERMWDTWKRQTQKLDVTEDVASTSTSRRDKKKSSTTTPLVVDCKHYRSFAKLCWTTMGYHYDWTMRCYHRTVKSEMPREIKILGKIGASTAWLHGPTRPCSVEPSTAANAQYMASASIVNYYNSKSVMGGHRDDLEIALDKPLVSISMGRPAIFILGQSTREESPVVPILVRPGDIMIMSGPCRLYYHAMATLLPESVTLPEPSALCCPTSNQQLKLDHITVTDECLSRLDDDERKAIDLYLSEHRININIRQVYPD